MTCAMMGAERNEMSDFKPFPYVRLCWTSIDGEPCCLGGSGIGYKIVALNNQSGAVYAYMLKISEQVHGRAYASKQDAEDAADAYENWIALYPPVRIGPMRERVKSRKIGSSLVNDVKTSISKAGGAA